MDETSELIRRWQKGDVKAFELLFLKYDSLVFNIAILMIGNKEQAEDVRQEVFISVWNSRRSFNSKKAKFKTWLYKIAINRSIDYYRKKRPPPFLEKETIDFSMINNNTPEEVLIKKNEHEWLMQAVRKLDEFHRSVLILRYFNELSYKEISDSLDIPLGTVKSRIHNAISILREYMETIELGKISGKSSCDEL